MKANLVPRPAPPAPSEPDHMVAYVGRLDAAKGVLLLMEAWDRYRATTRGGSLRLVIAGDGPLREHVNRWALTRPSVTCAGLLSPTESATLIVRARAVIVPSIWEETFGLVAVEAMAAGVPPIAAARGAFPELISDGIDGVLFEPGNSTSLAGALHDVDSNT